MGHTVRSEQGKPAEATGGALLDRVGTAPVAEMLHACLDAAGGTVALFDGDRGGLLLGGTDFRPLGEDPSWHAVGMQAIVRSAPVELIVGERILVAMPVVLQGRVLGSVACACGNADPQLLRALVAAAARALVELAARRELDAEHERLFAREQEARADAEAAQRRLAFLDQATAVLFGAPLDALQRLDTLVRLAVPDLADWCWVDLLGPDGVTLERSAIAHWNPVGAEVAAQQRGRRHPAGETGAGRAVREGAPVLLDSTGMRASADAPLLDGLGAKSALIMPLRVPGTTLGAMTFLFAESNRRYAEADLGLASDLAQRAALAVDNARLYQAAERAVRARDDMLAVVSHDLRNPLSAILANAGVLVRKAPAGDEGDRVRRRGEAIKRSAARMNHLIRDLLDMARIESRKLHIERSTHELAALVADALEMFQPLAGEGQIHLAAEPVDAALRLACDRERILQVFSNLLGNALKFTPPGGNIRLLARSTESAVQLGVADTGAGIAAENLENIFDRYWQVQASGRAGAGLGLSIARGIVEAHGGRIWAESELGAGSTFWFTVPCA